MFTSITGVFSKLKQHKIVQNISENYNKIKNQVVNKFQFTQIIPNLFHIPYPQQSTINILQKHIDTSNFIIINLSQYHYDKSIQNKLIQDSQKGQIKHLCYQYYPNIPLYQLLIAIDSIHSFLKISKDNKVYIHCQQNKIRSSVFLSCYLTKTKYQNIQDISDAVLYIDSKLNIKFYSQTQKQESKYKNQHLFLKNYINYLNNTKIINSFKLKITKIILNQAPKLKLASIILSKQQMVKIKPAIQIRQGDTIIFKSIFQSSSFQLDSLNINLTNKNIQVGDDFLIILKYAYENKIYNVLRIQLNSNFIFNGLARINYQQIDISNYSHFQNISNIFIDITFNQNNKYSSLALLDKQNNKQTKISETKIQNKIQQQKQTPIQSFSLNDQDDEEQNVDQHEINLKIKQVLKNMSQKQAQKAQQKQQEQQQQQDLDDYLSKLESQI